MTVPRQYGIITAPARPRGACDFARGIRSTTMRPSQALHSGILKIVEHAATLAYFRNPVNRGLPIFEKKVKINFAVGPLTFGSIARKVTFVNETCRL
jgi:hypothetical protein